MARLVEVNKAGSYRLQRVRVNQANYVGCTGILADSVVLSHARGTGWTVSHQADALAKLSLRMLNMPRYYLLRRDDGTQPTSPCCNNALADTKRRY